MIVSILNTTRHSDTLPSKLNNSPIEGLPAWSPTTISFSADNTFNMDFVSTHFHTPQLPLMKCPSRTPSVREDLGDSLPN